MQTVDWKDARQYCLDLIGALPSSFVNSLREHSLQDKEILYINLRWQFLRRHPQYIEQWQKSDGSAFGLQLTRCPDPAEAYPLGILFFHNSKGTAYALGQEQLEIAKQDPATLPHFQKFMQSLTRSVYPAMQRLGFSPPTGMASVKSRKKVRANDLSKALRVLDARAAGASIKEIENIIGNGTDKMGQLLIKRAQRALIEITGISS